MKKVTKQHKLNWVPISKAVDYALIDDYDDAQVSRQRVRNWCIRGFKKLNLNLLRLVKDVILPVNPKTGFVVLPEDYKQWAMVGYLDFCGRLTPLMKQVALMDLAPQHSCGGAGDHSLMESARYEVVTEAVVMGGQGYTKTIKRYIDRCNFVEETTEPVLLLSGAVEVQTRVETRCNDLETLPCGCIANSERNAYRLHECCCWGFHHLPEHYNRYHCVSENFSINEDAGLIQVDPSINRIYLKYIADAPLVDGELYVPEVALETLAAYALYKKDLRRNLPEVQKQVAYQNYTRERRELRKTLVPIRLSVIHNALNIIPHG